jgi:hypothetical protein
VLSKSEKRIGSPDDPARFLFFTQHSALST